MHLALEQQSNLHGDRGAAFATRPSLVNIVAPTPTLVFASPVHKFQPRSTPTPTCCPPNQVIIELSTTVIINDYQRYYSTDINSFIPTYFPTDDGSLITPALTDDLWDANLNLMLTAAFAMLFIRNIAVAIDYLRRGKMKNKTLFYLLLVSQALAPVSFVPSLLSFFNQYISCTVVIVLSATTGSLALTILLTGILGIKTYKCMNDSKTVAAIITILELGHATFVVLDAVAIRGARRIAGSCLRTSDLRYTRISAAIQMAECCFMVFCFVYTCIKYRKTPGARGRISLRMSMEDLPFDARGAENHEAARIGAESFWDLHHCDMPNEKITPSARSSIHAHPRSSVVLISPERPMNPPGSVRSHAHKSMASSSFSQLGKLLSNMASLRRVMRDELMYTCIITVVTTFALVFSFTGVNISNGLGVTGWTALTWGLVSVLIIHSSSRVIRRQEGEALRSAGPGTISRAAPTTPRFSRPNDCWLSTSSPQTRNRRDTRTSEATEQSDPFSDRRQLRQERLSSPQSGITSSAESNPSSPIVEITNLHDPAALPPSAHESSFPTDSGRVTPIVVQESILGNFSQEWVLEKNMECHHSTNGADESGKSQFIC